MMWGGQHRPLKGSDDMAEVKWIKIVTDIFDDEKMLLIDALPDHDTIIVIWFKLLCLAGKQNNGGVFMMNDKIAYTDEMLATIFRRPLNTVRLALDVFCKYQMIEIVDDTITIPNWERHQSLDSYEKKKERDRQYQARLRERQKGLLSEKSSDNRLTSDDKSSLVVSVEQEEERELEEDREIEEDTAATQRGAVCPFKTIVELYHTLAPSFPKIRSVDGNRRKAVSARWRQWHDLEVFRTIFTKAEASSFLKGGGKNNWHADFDWMMKPTNFQKILEGKYDSDDRDFQKPTGSVFDTLRQMHEEASE